MLTYFYIFFQPCLFGGKAPIAFKEQASENLKRKYQYSDTDISFVPQKRPSKLHSPIHDEINFYKKIKRKHKTHQKSPCKDIYKVEVVNSHPSNSNNDSITSDKPPVIIRIKRVQNSKNKYPSSDVESHITISSSSSPSTSSSSSSSSSSDNDDYDDDINVKKIPEETIPVHRYIRVVRKPSFSNETEVTPIKSFTESQMFTFEHPELRQNIHKNCSYYPTYTCIPDTKSSVKYIQEKIENLGNPSLKCTLSFKDSLKVMSNMKPTKIGEWFYNVPKKIQDNLSFNSSSLVPLTELSKIKSFVAPKRNVIKSSSSSSSIEIL